MHLARQTLLHGQTGLVIHQQEGGQVEYLGHLGGVVTHSHHHLLESGCVVRLGENGLEAVVHRVEVYASIFALIDGLLDLLQESHETDRLDELGLQLCFHQGTSDRLDLIDVAHGELVGRVFVQQGVQVDIELVQRGGVVMEESLLVLGIGGSEVQGGLDVLERDGLSES